jgi:hypothetical protein
MLAIAIHDNDHVTSSIKNSFLNGTGKAMASNPTYQVETAIAMGQLTNPISGTIGGIVINEEKFEIVALLQGQQIEHHRLDALPLIKSRENNR